MYTWLMEPLEEKVNEVLKEEGRYTWAPIQRTVKVKEPWDTVLKLHTWTILFICLAIIFSNWLSSLRREQTMYELQAIHACEAIQTVRVSALQDQCREATTWLQDKGYEVNSEKGKFWVTRP